jgi:hypothetical protein
MFDLNQAPTSAVKPKSPPFLKGDLGEFEGLKPNPPWPPFRKGGKKIPNLKEKFTVKRNINEVVTREFHGIPFNLPSFCRSFP